MKTMILTNNKTEISQTLQLTGIREYIKGFDTMLALEVNTEYGYDEIIVNKETTILEEIKIVNSKKETVKNILKLRKSFIELVKQNKISHSDYQCIARDTFKFKGSDENTEIWLMRKTKKELNNICDRLNKRLMN